MDIAVKIVNLSKQYQLGQINTGSLVRDLESWFARVRGKEDPNTIVGSEQRGSKHGTFWALRNINLEIKQGERVGVIGHNGAGKSTLLKLISQITAPTTGEIYLDGRVASMLEVGAGFHLEMTGRENVYMNGAILGMSRRETDAVMDDIIAFSECGQFIDTPVKRYSSGMYVKLAFAVAAHLNSDIVIMDEVLAVGDYQFQKKSMDRMYHMAVDEGRTVLCVSHNMANIRQLCSRCIVLDQGQIVFDGDVEKGIAIYQDRATDEARRSLYRLTMDSNYYEKNFGAGAPRLEMEEIEFLDTKDCIYMQGDAVRFCLRWKCQRADMQLRLRLRLRAMNGVPVGASESEVFTPQKADTLQQTVFSLPTEGLVPGEYSLALEFFPGEDLPGLAQTLEAAIELLTIEILAEEDTPVWPAGEWGSVQLRQMKVET